jgi:hypothetical protein
VVWKLVNVVSCPPCCVAVEANTLPIFPISDPFGPQRSRLIEEIAYLRGHIAEARWSAKDDGVRVGQLVHGRDRHFGERGFRPMLFQHIVGNQLATWYKDTSAPGSRLAPSTTACAIL